MTKAELAAKIGQNVGISAVKATTFINAFMDIAIEELQQKREIRLVGFGALKPVNRKAREVRNPQTGQKMKIPARNTVTFTPGKALKEALN